MGVLGYATAILTFLAFFSAVEFLFALRAAKKTKLSAKTKRARFEAMIDDVPLPPMLWTRRGQYSTNLKVDMFLKRFAVFDRIYIMTRRCGKPVLVDKIVFLMAGLCFSFLLISAIIGLPWFFVLVFAGLGLCSPVLCLAVLIKKRNTLIERYLPDVLDAISSSMRAGHAFSSAFRIAGMQAQEPVSTEFRIASDEMSFGSSVRDAILGIAERVDLMDVRYFVLTVIIQLDAGGSMSGLLSDLSRLVRERLKLRKTIRTLSAEGRLSALVLLLLPIAFGGLMAFMSPMHVRFFMNTEIGKTLLEFMAVMMVIGFLWINRIINIRA